MKKHLPYVFVSSAGAASSGLAMVTTPVEHAGPARALGMAAAASDLVATKVLEEGMEPEPREALHEGRPGALGGPGRAGGDSGFPWRGVSSIGAP